MATAPALKIARRMSIAHGRTLAEEWMDDAFMTFSEAYERLGLVEWPDDDREAVERYEGIEDEIFTRVVDAVREPIAKAFVKAARSTLGRERRRQRNRLNRSPRTRKAALTRLASFIVGRDMADPAVHRQRRSGLQPGGERRGGK
jgi:hypothetical protein